MGGVIIAVHNLVYADDPEAARRFFRDVLGWPNIDAHDGWLIFRTGPSELGVHPTSGEDPSWSTGPHHEISLMCDDLEATVEDLRAKGAEFTRGIESQGFGRTTMLKIPGAGEMMLYEARHATAFDI